MNDGNLADVTADDSTSSKYKSGIFKILADGDDGVFKDVKIVVSLKYLSNIFSSLEMPLINCKTHLEVSWTEKCVRSNIDGAATFKIKDKNLYVPIVTLSTKDNVNLTKQLNEGFKRSVYLNEYKSKIETKKINNNSNNNPQRFYLDAFFERVKRLFVLAFGNTFTAGAYNTEKDGPNRVKRDCHRKCFLPRANVTSYNVLIDGRNFYDQLINDQIKKYNEIRKIAT